MTGIRESFGGLENIPLAKLLKRAEYDGVLTENDNKDKHYKDYSWKIQADWFESAFSRTAPQYLQEMHGVAFAMSEDYKVAYLMEVQDEDEQDEPKEKKKITKKSK